MCVFESDARVRLYSRLHVFDVFFTCNKCMRVVTVFGQGFSKTYATLGQDYLLYELI